MSGWLKVVEVVFLYLRNEMAKLRIIAKVQAFKNISHSEEPARLA